MGAIVGTTEEVVLTETVSFEGPAVGAVVVLGAIVGSLEVSLPNNVSLEDATTVGSAVALLGAIVGTEEDNVVLSMDVSLKGPAVGATVAFVWS